MTNESLSSESREIMTWHRIIEAFKFAYAKRTDLGDGDGEDEAFKQQLNKVCAHVFSYICNFKQ